MPRAHLFKLTPNDIINDQEQHAIAEIDAALREIRAAAIDDGKNLDEHPPIDLTLIKTDRYHQALELLQKAGADVSHEEDNPATQGLQHRALMHVNAAQETLTALMRETHHHIDRADHPAYLQALSELRFARAHLFKLTPNDIINDQEQHAIAEIDAALREIRAAAIDDGKNLDEHPPIDLTLIKTDRYHQALELLQKAGADVSHEEDNPATQGLQHRALMHVNAAQETLTALMRETHHHIDRADHPAYLQALSELRFARAHLFKLTPNDIINDQEQHAIAEIDAALREIRAAAINDGKNLDEHPPIDLTLIKTDRYHQALELLQKAGADVSHEEDNPATQGLQHRALMHVNAAQETLTALMRETHHHIDRADHPAYLQALSELRFARAHLFKLTPNDIINDQEQHAIAEIDAALREIRAAAIDDGKNLDEHPPIDLTLIKTDRYHQALELLQKAGADVSHEEDNPATQGLQHRALMHVNAAQETLTALMRETHHHIDRADHPAYLQALSELRFARAFIEKFRPEEAVSDQEQHAIAEIDAALREIRAAAIDDGKNLDEHPPINVSLIKTDRYHKALELLAKASQDLKHEEDETAAKGLQHRALAHIGSAEKAVHEAIVAGVK